jgi:hypothetical protein
MAPQDFDWQKIRALEIEMARVKAALLKAADLHGEIHRRDIEEILVPEE